jgi:hypothetical protein
VDVVLLFCCAVEVKLNRLLVGAGAVAVAFPVLCALVPMLNKLFCGISCWVEVPFCVLAPNPLKILFCAGAALVEVPNPLNMLLVAGVLAVFCALVLAAPNVKGVAAGVGALDTFDAVLVVPNMLVAGGALLVPNSPPEPADVVVLVCARPPKGLLGACELNMEPPPNAAGVLPFMELPFVGLPKGFALPAVKLKSFAVGGWGLKPVLCEVAPNAGNDELLKVLLGAADCAGGKLFVAPPPKALLPPPNMPPLVLLLLPPTAGADAPKPKPDCCDVPKLALCEGVCARVLASCFACRRRISRRPAVVLYLVDDMPRGAPGMRLRAQSGQGWYSRQLLRRVGVLWQS